MLRQACRRRFKWQRSLRGMAHSLRTEGRAEGRATHHQDKRLSKIRCRSTTTSAHGKPGSCANVTTSVDTTPCAAILLLLKSQTPPYLASSRPLTGPPTHLQLLAKVQPREVRSSCSIRLRMCACIRHSSRPLVRLACTRGASPTFCWRRFPGHVC